MVSIPEFLTIIKVSVTAVVAYTFASFLLSRGTNVPRSVPILAGMYLIAGLAGTRLAYRLLVDGSILPTSVLKNNGRAFRNVVLLGMTDSAESFIRLTRRGSLAGVNVVGVLDESPGRHARTVQGVKVYESLDDLEAVVNRLARKSIKVSELIVTETSPGRQRLGHIVERATSLGLKAAPIPMPDRDRAIDQPFDPGAEGDRARRPARKRPEVVADVQGIAGLINERTVLVTGAGGSIGSELCRQIARFARAG